jgi:hypothetical protein
MAPGSFAFTKWYLDCLDRDGRLVIVYWASLEWRRLRLTWHSAAVFAPGVRADAKSSVIQVDAPRHSGSTVSFKSDRIDCDAMLRCGVGGIAPQRLADGVTWTCVAPAARAVVRVGNTTIEGTGYAECMELRVPPWKLGIAGLRWGRWISDDASRSMVWIAWNGGSKGSHPERSEGTAVSNRWLFLDDKATHVTAMDDNPISNGAASLALGAPTILVDRGIGHTISKIPALRAVAPKWLVGGNEVRRTRAGTLREGSSAIRGTAVDELVEFG